jgi:hypothetical protein
MSAPKRRHYVVHQNRNLTDQYLILPCPFQNTGRGNFQVANLKESPTKVQNFRSDDEKLPDPLGPPASKPPG